MISAFSNPAAEPPMPPFDLVVDAPARVLRLSGELDASTAPVIVDAATLVRAVFGAGDLALDLSGVTFIGADALGAIVRVANAQHAGADQLEVRHASEWVARVFAFGGLDELLAAA